MNISPLNRIRSFLRRWCALAHGERWFPQVPRAIALAGGGLLLLHLDFQRGVDQATKD